MKTTKHQGIWAATIALTMFSGITIAADPLADAVAAKTATAKVATDKAAAANTAAREAVSARADAARAVSDASLALAAAKKAAATKAAAAKAATEKANASKSEADKAAANKAAADKTAADKTVTDLAAKVAAAAKARTATDVALKDANEKYKVLRRATYPVLEQKALAEKALAEKTATDRAAAAKAAAAKVSLATAALNKAKAELAAAGKSCKDCVAKAAAAKKAVAGKADAAKVAAEKAAKDAETKAAAAKKALAAKGAAVKNAEKALAAAQAASKNAATAKVAADKNRAAKTTAHKVALETLNGSSQFIAVVAVDDARKEKVAAEKAVAKTAGLESKAKSFYNTAKAAADKATAAKTAAEKALAAAEGKKAAAKKACDAKTAVAKAAAAKAATDKPAADKAKAEQAAAAKALAAADAACVGAKKARNAKIAAAKAAAAKAAAAKAAADKAVAATQAARVIVAEKVKAIPPLQDKLAVARRVTMGGLKPMPSSKWDYAKARHLVVRAGFGGTPAEVQKVYEMGLHDAVDYFVEIYDRPAANIEFDPARLTRTRSWQSRLPWDERQYMTVKYRNPERRLQSEMRKWWLQRMAESPRPLQEKLTLFWHDHFATQYKKRYRTFMLFKQNQLFRTYGTDNYAALLRGIVHDPATISYLDNNVNYKGSGNENLGREILELFSIGEGRGYSEEDLREASRALTGYNYDSWTGQFRYIATRHDLENKKIMGSTGNWSGDDLVDIILRQPATGTYITGKLFKFLVHDEPQTATTDQMAELMRYCGYDLRPMLRNLFISEEFYSSKAMGSHIKGPVELAVGAIRDLGIKDVNYASVDSAVNQMGQLLFEPPNVAGWNEGRTWINAERILVRYNQMARLLEQPNVDLVALLKGTDVSTPQKIVDELIKACLVVKPNSEESRALAEYLGELPPAAEWDAKRDQINAKLRAVLVLLMSTPESQLG